MKKSEALNIIVDWFYWAYNSPKDVYEDAEILLLKLEAAGMKPPQRNADLKSSYGYAQVQEWEQE